MRRGPAFLLKAGDLKPENGVPTSLIVQAMKAAHSRDPAPRADLNCVSLLGGYAMRSYDLAPLYRSTVGFDRLFSMMDQLGAFDQPAPSYPPYNIEKTGENDYRISLAVAGFAEADLTILSEANLLVVRGEKKAESEKKDSETLFQGIAARQFERRFQLADYVSVVAARLENGLLHIELVREVPEARKPRVIAIGEKGPTKTVQQIAA